MNVSKEDQILQLVRERGMIRARDLAKYGYSPRHLRRLCEEGLLTNSGRGIYLPAEAELNSNSALAEVAMRVPTSVICLLSALQFHGLTTQLPHQVWIALPTRAHSPKLVYPPIRMIHLSGEAFTEGIESHQILDVPVRIYTPAKTVADCFKYRNKIGTDVALEALQDCWQKHAATMDELWRYATICRVANVMRPYLESLGT